MAIDDLARDDGALIAPPYDVEQEEAILGSVLLDPESIGLVAHSLKPEHFFRERNGEIFGAMLALFDRRVKIDYLTLGDELRQRGSLERVGGLAFLWGLLSVVPTSLHIEEYAENVNRKAFMRRLIQAGQQIVQLGYRDAESGQRTLERAERLLLEAASGQASRDFATLAEILTEYMERLTTVEEGEDRLRFGLPTGFIDLDKLLGGLQRANLVILAARPAMGKTSLALNLAAHAALKDHARVAMFSLEMSRYELAARLLSTESGVDSTRLRSGHLNQTELARLSNALAALSETEFYVDDTAGIRISELRFKAKRLASTTAIDLVVIDYLQLIQGTKSDNRVQEISEISRSLKNLALELHVPVLALSQLSRAVESRSPKIPQLSDLRESGCLAGETLVYLPGSGSYRPIAELVGQRDFDVLALNQATWKLEPRRVLKAFSTGVKPVSRLTTRLGRTLRATANHKFLAFGGWRRLDELAPGVRLAVPRGDREVRLVRASHPVPSSHPEPLLCHSERPHCHSERPHCHSEPPHCHSEPFHRHSEPFHRHPEPFHRRPEPFHRRPEPFHRRPEPPHCHPERSEGSGGKRDLRLHPILRCAQDDNPGRGLPLTALNSRKLVRTLPGPVAIARRCTWRVLLRAAGQEAQSDVYWDEILSIEPDGETEVFDLTVEGLHNFVANDITVHNSIEQDADVVMFIYRDDYYNKDSEQKGIAEIHVAKHRNGPTGEVRLVFNDRSTRFLNLQADTY